MPTDLKGWADILNTTGLLGGFIAILFGYFKQWWIGGFAHAQMRADYEKRLADQKADYEKRLADERADRVTLITAYEARIATIRADHSEREKTLRAEHTVVLQWYQARAEKLEQFALRASDAIDKIQGVASRAVEIVGQQNQREGTPQHERA